MNKILFAASESVPFIKTGGLADVVGSLPKYLDKRYFDCRVILPKYLCMKREYLEKLEYVTHFYMYYNGRDRYVGVLRTEYDGVTFYFIDNEEYFGGSSPYSGGLYDIEKFIFFSQAVLSALPLIDFRPDIIHCHDWQSALIPVYLKDRFAGGEFFRGIKSVVTIHNLKFQGVWDIPTIKAYSGLSDYYFTPDKLENNRGANMLKGGITYADAVTTVSRTYAEEIQTPYFGEGLDGLMSARRGGLRGIVNGIDYEDFDPGTDQRIYKNYTSTTFRTDRQRNKTMLQTELGLEVNNKKMLIGIVSRLTEQKGIDLIKRMMNEIVDEGIQLAVLGTGEYEYEEMFRYFARTYPDRVAAVTRYSEDTARKIYAGTDAFLMPSKFEPCGLSQLIALRYGSVPVVRETGGLKDTVEPFNEYADKGTGFSFANYNAHEMMNAVRYAKHVFTDRKRTWNRIVERGMNADFSWDSSAKKYQELYDWLKG